MNRCTEIYFIKQVESISFILAGNKMQQFLHYTLSKYNGFYIKTLTQLMYKDIKFETTKTKLYVD